MLRNRELVSLLARPNFSVGEDSSVYVCAYPQHWVMSNSLWLHGWQPASLFCLLVSPGKNTRVGCNFLLQGIFRTWDQTLISYISCIGRRVLCHSALSLHCAAGCGSVPFVFSFWSSVSSDVFKKKKKKKKNFVWKLKHLELDMIQHKITDLKNLGVLCFCAAVTRNASATDSYFHLSLGPLLASEDS